MGWTLVVTLTQAHSTPITSVLSMELFAAATGCLDPKVASLYLERAGNDVTRAVNHYLDAPPSTGSLAEAGMHSLMSVAKANNKQNSQTQSSSTSTHSGLKRPRHGGGVQQEVLSFQPSRPRSKLKDQITGFPLSAGMGKRQPELTRDSTVQRSENTGSNGRSPGRTGSWREKEPDAAPVLPPSPEWTEIAERCRRHGIQFDDEQFPPRPTSLDGRPGTATPPGEKQNREKQDAKQGARCKCGMPAKVVTVNKAGPNQGKLFYGCLTRKCNFFRWADDAPHTRQALSLVWKRFSPPRFKLTTTGSARHGESGFKPQDIKQGAVGDCWFLAGLAVVSERSDLITRVVGCNPQLCDDVGCFEVNLFKDGSWQRVLVDSWLPCKDPTGLKGKEKGMDHLPAFAKASNNQIWPCIVEKAFAKQHGSFDAISGGHVCEAFEALTGAPTETVQLDDDDSEANWAKLLSFSHAQFPMGCATAWDPTRDLRDVGLVSTHAYSVLEVRELPFGVRGARQPTIKDWAGLGSATAAAAKARQQNGEESGQPPRLLRIRNPWGKTEWTGEWSDKSERWSDSVREELGWSKKNDGTFWMTWQDFMTRFQLVDVCKARRGWSHTSIASGSLPKPDACRSFSVRPPDDEGSTWAYLTVVQPTKRGRKDSYWYKAFGLILTEADSYGASKGGATLQAASLCGAKRSTSCEVFLEGGKVYTASVLCLGGNACTSGYPSSQGHHKFHFTVYSARPIQVASMEKSLHSLAAVTIGPPLHQAVSHRWLQIPPLVDISADANDKFDSFALCPGAALTVVPVGGSAAFFVLINTMSSTTIGVRLSITSLEGASAMGAIRTHQAGEVLQWECPPMSQKITLILARMGDHGVFRHAFFYRLVSPAVAPPLVSYTSAHQPGLIAATPGCTDGVRVEEPTLSSQEVLDLSSIDDNDNGRKGIGLAIRPEVLDLSAYCDDSDGNTKRGAGGQTSMGGAARPHGSEGTRRVEKPEACHVEGIRGDGTGVGNGGGRDGDPDPGGGSTTKSTRGAGGVFSAQPLLPGAEAAVMRAHEKEGRSKVGAVIEGYGGGTVGEGGRGIGSASK